MDEWCALAFGFALSIFAIIYAIAEIRTVNRQIKRIDELDKRIDELKKRSQK